MTNRLRWAMALMVTVALAGAWWLARPDEAAGEIEAAQQALTAWGLFAGDGQECRRLAGSVRAEQADHFTGLDLEVHRSNHLSAEVPGFEVAGLQQGRLHDPPPPATGAGAAEGVGRRSDSVSSRSPR